MFISGVPEKIVGEVTGHKSLKALRTYERTTEEQQRAAGLAISNISALKCEDKMNLESAVSGTENVKMEDSSDVPKASKVAQLPQISGTLSNCTFNFNF